MRQFCCALILLSILSAPILCAEEHENIDLVKRFHSWWDQCADMAVNGDYIYIAAYHQGLLVIKIEDLGNFKLVSFPMPDLSVDQIVAWDDFAFLTCSKNSPSYTEHLILMDISDREQPVEITRYNLEVEDIAIVEDIVAFAAGYTILIFDISDPAEMFLLTEIETDSFNYSVHIQDDMLFASQVNNLQFYNIADPEEPVLHSQLGFEYVRSELELAVVDEKLYAAGWDLSLHIYDISNIEEPAFIGRYSTGEPCMGLSVIGDILYYACGELAAEGSKWQGVYSLDVTDPENIAVLDSLPGGNRHLMIQNEIAYVSDRHKIEMVDISDPEDLNLVGSYASTHSDVRAVALDGDRAYLACRPGNYPDYIEFFVFDISDPLDPVQMGVLAGPSYPREINIHETIAYLTTQDGLSIVDVSDPDTITILDKLDTESIYSTYYYDYKCYLAHRYSISIVDVSNPYRAETRVSTTFNISGYRNELKGFVVEGNVGYLLANQTERDDDVASLIILDMDDIDRGDTLTFRRFEGRLMDAVVKNDLLYLSRIKGVDDSLLTFIEIWDVTFPTGPVQLGLCQIGEGNSNQSYRRKMSLDGNFLFVACQDEGLRLVDVSDPEHLFEAGFHETYDEAIDVAVNDKLILVAERGYASIFTSDLLHINEGNSELTPLDFNVSTYPNPFNASLRIDYTIPHLSDVAITLYDLSGRIVSSQTLPSHPMGSHMAVIDGAELASGVYWVKVATGEEVRARKVVLMK
ncbi:T9SS type A sorting domain-containing protein [Calditrichota bacterium]